MLHFLSKPLGSTSSGVRFVLPDTAFAGPRALLLRRPFFTSESRFGKLEERESGERRTDQAAASCQPALGCRGGRARPTLSPGGRGAWGGGDRAQPMARLWGWPWSGNTALGLCSPGQRGCTPVTWGVSRASQAPGHPVARRVVVWVMLGSKTPRTRAQRCPSAPLAALPSTPPLLSPALTGDAGKQ